MFSQNLLFPGVLGREESYTTNKPEYKHICNPNPQKAEAGGSKI